MLEDGNLVRKDGVSPAMSHRLRTSPASRIVLSDTASVSVWLRHHAGQLSCSAHVYRVARRKQRLAKLGQLRSNNL